MKDTPMGMPRVEWSEDDAYEGDEPTHPSTPPSHTCYYCGKITRVSRHGVAICNECDVAAKRKK
jgi:hypothetical protein